MTVIQRILKYMVEQKANPQGVRPSRCVAIRNTYADLTDTTIRDWMGICEGLGPYTAGGMSPPSQRLRFRLDDGTRVEADMIFISLDRPEHVRKLKGTQLTYVWANEASELAKVVIDQADLRHGRYPATEICGVDPTWHGILGDTNAPDDDHWYAELERDPPAGWEFFVQPGGLQRAGTLPNGRVRWIHQDHENAKSLLRKYPEGYYLRGMAGKSDAWIAVFLGNELGSVFAGKPVWQEYRENLHLSPIPLVVVPGLTIYVGLDFGLTPAAVLGQRVKGGRWQIFREICATDMGAKQFAKVLGTVLRDDYKGYGFSIWGDPAGDQRSQGDSDDTVFKILKLNGIAAHPAPTNDFTLRREAVANQMTRMVDGTPALLIDPSCTMIKKGCAGGYRFKRLEVAGEERFKDVPLKNAYSHPCEALQYLMIGAGEGDTLIRSADSGPVQTSSRPENQRVANYLRTLGR